MKKKILLVSDVKGWGGWKRALKIKEHLSDEFNFNLMDQNEYKNYLVRSSDAFSETDLIKFTRNSESSDKEYINTKEFLTWLIEKRIKDDYDLTYLLFHTMLMKKSVKRVLKKKIQKIITIVTVFPTIRPIFFRAGGVKSFTDYANLCSGVLVNNKKSLEDLKSIKEYKRKTYYAPRGVDSKVFYPTNNFKEKPHAKFTVAFCGKANPEKGLESIIRPACIKAGVKLITNERNFTDALSEDEMRVFYNKADAYIVASTMDGTPNTALEAASCGKPIISNDIGNMPEFIEKGVNGYFVPELTVHKYANRLRWMKKNQQKVWEVGKNARKTILKDWTWEIVLNRNERRIFKEIIG